VKVDWGVSVAVGVLVRVDVGVEVGASNEAEEGRNVLNKHENTPAASSSASIISSMRHRVFKVSSSSLFLGSTEAKSAKSSGRNEC